MLVGGSWSLGRDRGGMAGFSGFCRNFIRACILGRGDCVLKERLE